MSPKELFESGERDTATGVFPRDWFGFGTTFVPQPVAFEEGRSILGMRMLAGLDLASRFCLGTDLLERKPGVLYASRLIPFMDRVIGEFSKPTKGVVISHSCWLSSAGLAEDPETRDQGKFLREIGVSFGPMPHREGEKLVEWGEGLGLAVLFDADGIY